MTIKRVMSMRTLPTTKRINGAVIYRGLSVLTAMPIVVILTGLKRKSENEKTGNMIQVWILPETNPLAAVQSGADSAVCGDCPQRRTKCYVRVEQAPLSVWEAWKRGSYHDWTGKMPAKVLSGRAIRVGAYGDPVAAPMSVWRKILRQPIAGWTGYTHQWRRPDAKRFNAFLMASADTEEDAKQAWSQGWRTFRIRKDGNVPLVQGTEIICPASDEGGNRLTCEKCMLCSGKGVQAKNIVIIAHGKGANNRKRKSK